MDLRFPEYIPVTIMDPDSGFSGDFVFRIPESKIQVYQRHKTTYQQACACNHSALFLVSEFGKEKGRKHYHVILLLNKDTCSLGDFTVPSSLATLIKLAWWQRSAS